MDFKLIILVGVFLTTNASTQKQNSKNSRRTKSIKTAPSSNRFIIRVENLGSFTTAVPDVTTYRPRFPGSYIRTSTSSSTPGNYQSPANYEPEQYQNYQPRNYQSAHYESGNYHSSEVRSVWEANKLEKDPSGINYLSETNFVQPERVNLLKNVVNPEYGPVLSKSGYAIVPNASPNSVTVKPNDYVSPIYGRNSLSPGGFSNFNRVDQKPMKIAYSPANEVSHVSYSAGNGQVYYSW